jgi:hypothetical protein
MGDKGVSKVCRVYKFLVRKAARKWHISDKTVPYSRERNSRTENDDGKQRP